MTETDGNERHDRDPRGTLLREVAGWTHHVANLDRENAEVRTVELDRPVSIAQRRAAVAECFGGERELPISALAVVERTLSPRESYIATPLSHVAAIQSCWEFRPDAGVLLWEEPLSSGRPKRDGYIALRYYQVTPESLVLITLSLGVQAEPDVRGGYSVFSESLEPLEFPLWSNDYRRVMVDLVARPATDSLWMNIMPITTGMRVFEFFEATFRYL